jgi:hypothetical protein
MNIQNSSSIGSAMPIQSASSLPISMESTNQQDQPSAVENTRPASASGRISLSRNSSTVPDQFDGEAVSSPHEMPSSSTRPVIAQADSCRMSSHLLTVDETQLHPTSTHFIQSIHNHLHAYWEVGRTASLDQISGDAFSSRRTSELESIPGSGYLPNRYALKVADTSRDFTEQKGIRLYHEESGVYHRSDPDDYFLQHCLSLYEKSKPKEHVLEENRVVFTHSQLASERLKKQTPYMFHKDDQEIFKNTKIHPVVEGLVATEFEKSSFAGWGYYYNLKWGGTPSLYEVAKRSHIAPNAPPVLLDPNIDNAFTLHTILSNVRIGIPKSIATLSEERPLKNLANIIFSAVGGLDVLLERKGSEPSFKQNPILANRLNALTKAVKDLPSLTNDEIRFFSAYDIIIEELNSILISFKPYGENDFKSDASRILQSRLGIHPEDLKIHNPEVHMFSSGMEAFITAVEIAQEESETKSVQCISNNELLPDYFETIEAIGNRQNNNNNSNRVFLANLNPSVPFKRGPSDVDQNWDVDKLIAFVETKMNELNIQADDPLYLVLDSSIDKPNLDSASDLGKFTNAMSMPLTNKRLRLLIYNSDQKFQSLFTRRIMAGELTIIGFNDDKTQRMVETARAKEQSVGWINNDECQLLMHLKKYAHSYEMISIRNAAKTIEFMHKHCFPSPEGFILYESGLPLAIVTDGKEEINIKFTKEGAEEIRGKPFSDLMEFMLDYHNGFGFLQTTFTKTPTAVSEVRISGGQESFELTAERFYALGWLKQRLNQGDKLLAVDDVLKEIKLVTNGACETILKRADICKWGKTAISLLERKLFYLKKTAINALRLAASNKLLEAASLNAFILAEEFVSSVSINELKVSLKNQHELVNLPRSSLLKGQDELRDKLTRVLSKTSKYFINSLGKELELISSAFAPVLPDSDREEIDIGVMRLRLERNPIGMNCEFTGSEDDEKEAISARYATNKVASLLVLAGNVFSEESEKIDDHVKGFDGIYSEEQLKPLCTAFETFLGSDLSCVTPLFRVMILDNWFKLSKEKFANPAQRETAVHNLIKFSRHISWTEEKAKLIEKIHDDDFGKLPLYLQVDLVSSLFKPLDIVSRGIFVKRLRESGQEQKSKMCLAIINEDMIKADNRNIGVLRPSRIDGSAVTGTPYELVNADQRRKIIHESLIA